MNYSRPYRSTEPPEQNSSTNPPMVYVTEPLVWEYKRLTRSLSHAPLPGEAELNEYGKEGWELVSTISYAESLYLYFKRLVR
jgi:hypothetical protein